MVAESLFLDISMSDSGNKKLQSKDYSSYLDFITIYMISLCVIFLIFFKTKMKRTIADGESSESNETLGSRESSVKKHAWT